VAVALLERDAELAALTGAVASAAAGAGSVVLVAGEAGIGKTALLRAFRRSVGGRVRLLAGACDDLVTPRTYGPLRDAFGADGGPLAEALAAGDREGVLSGLHAELAGAARSAPVVWLVEDAHWADDATLDVLGFVSRRIPDLPAVLVVTFRDDEVRRDHRLQRVLGVLTGEHVHRLALQPLSRAAVARWSGGTTLTSAALYQLTGGNPFFVSELLAAPAGAVPATVVDAVLVRVRSLGPPARRALDQLAVVPSRVELPVARALLGDLGSLAEAERLGIIEVHGDAVAFRHELARRAVEGSLPQTELIELNARVLAVLLEQSEPDLARVVHHAVQAGDDAAVLAYAPEAARRACAAGAQGQGAALYEQVLRRARLLAPEQRAEVGEAYAMTLFHANQRRSSVRAAEEAVRLREGRPDRAALGRALAMLALHQWADLQPTAALESAERALSALESVGDSVDHAAALIHISSLLIPLDRERDGLARAEAGLAMAERVGAEDLQSLGRLYRGRALLQLGDESGLHEMRAALDLALARRSPEEVMFGYLNLVPVLWRTGRYAEMEQQIDAWAEYAREREFRTHDQTRDAYRYSLLALRGEWIRAEQGLRAVLHDARDPGISGRHALPALARLAARLGREDAESLLAAARATAEQAGSDYVLVPVVVAAIEQAWLTGRTGVDRTERELLARSDRPGRERQRGELLRWLRRAGEPVEPFDGCPDEFAAGLRGDWRAAAAAWERVGDPYERALELLDSGEVEPTVEALTVFESLTARPAADLARRQLRRLGVRNLPRRPHPTTRENPAGLTNRQVEILRLLGEGLTNAEIAHRLVLSVRTVDHHVSAVLQKLGITSRRDAAAAVTKLGI